MTEDRRRDRNLEGERTGRTGLRLAQGVSRQQVDEAVADRHSPITLPSSVFSAATSVVVRLRL